MGNYVASPTTLTKEECGGSLRRAPFVWKSLQEYLVMKIKSIQRSGQEAKDRRGSSKLQCWPPPEAFADPIRAPFILHAQHES